MPLADLLRWEKGKSQERGVFGLWGIELRANLGRFEPGARFTDGAFFPNGSLMLWNTARDGRVVQSVVFTFQEEVVEDLDPETQFQAICKEQCHDEGIRDRSRRGHLRIVG